MALERLTQVTTIGIASSVSLSGNIGIGTTNPTSTLHVAGTVLVTGVSTLGTLQISSGIVTATTGIITYYGDGSKLSGVSASGGSTSLDILEVMLFS